MQAMSQKHNFRINGYEFSLDEERIEGKLKSLKEPEEIRKVYVEVKGRRWPIKQALHASVHGLTRSGFTTQDAVRVFRKFGFKVGEI